MKLLLADSDGNIYEHPWLNAAAFDGCGWTGFSPAEAIRLPSGSKLFTLPGRLPVGIDPDSSRFEIVHRFEVDNGKGFIPVAVSAFLPPAYMRLLLPAYVRNIDAPVLPQWAYTAIAAGEDGIHTAALRVDSSDRWDPNNYDDTSLHLKIEKMNERFPGNRLLEHLAHCASVYHCFAAKNLFFGRWEAPLPVARKCNASCLGCLSLQTGNIPSSHNRIDFTPTAEEIAEIAITHLTEAEDPIVSYGQGCEGEPLTEWELICESIRLIRSQTGRGAIHLNTNGSMPDVIPHLAAAGLNSVRISMNSALEDKYERYFQPADYTLSDVVEFIRCAKALGLFVHINLLVFPGVTDSKEEFAAFSRLVEDINPDLIQLKNLNIDPDYYLESMETSGEPMGLKFFRQRLHLQFPRMRFGYFNLQKEKFHNSLAV